MEIFADAGMLDAAGRALLIIMEPSRLGLLALGVLAGLVIGILPGIGGLTGFALIMPFTFTMDPYSAFAILLGMAAVTSTSDTIPAVLFGVPGTASSQATVLDGMPMAARGEAGRALSAAYTASLIGGLFGALILGISIPLLRPFVLAIGSPELLALTVLGISMVASLSGGSPLRGLIIAGIGIVLAMIGTDPKTATFRWTMNSLYLWDGLPILPVVLGIFALPEMCDLAIKRSALADKISFSASEGMIRGVRDCFSNLGLILRCSGLGAALGALPGVSGSVVDWFAYGHAVRTVKGADETFGTGDVRGVIAPESANNAQTGGGLVPTLAFGVPGGASMALFLGAIMIHGIVPGPDMLTRNLDITYSMVWSIAIANIIGAGVCFLFANQFAKLTIVRFTLLLPVIMVIIFVGAYQGSRNWGDIYTLLIFGVIGWTMKRLGWPRPPLILGLVLGLLIERYLAISIARYGMEWVFRPAVLILLLFAAFVLLQPLWRQVRQLGPSGVLRFKRPVFRPEDLFYLPVFGIAALMLVQSLGWRFEARIGPIIVLGAILCLCALSFAAQVLSTSRSGDIESAPRRVHKHIDLRSEASDLPQRTVLLRAAAFLGWLLAFVVSMAVIGVFQTAPLFIIAYMRIEGRESWRLCLIYAFCMTAFLYIVFERTLHVPWPTTVIGELFPSARSVLPSL